HRRRQGRPRHLLEGHGRHGRDRGADARRRDRAGRAAEREEGRDRADRGRRAAAAVDARREEAVGPPVVRFVVALLVLCARIKAGTTVYERPGAAVGKARADAVGTVEERGDWYRLRFERVREGGSFRPSDGDVTVVVPRRDAQAARCPAGSNGG